jgi:hypothetical protein
MKKYTEMIISLNNRMGDYNGKFTLTGDNTFLFSINYRLENKYHW